MGVLSNCFSYWLLASSYQINKAYIANVLCTNKDKPELHCDGVCFLDIRLKELADKHQHDQDYLKRIIETVALTSISLLPNLYESVIETKSSIFDQEKPVAGFHSIFHPPQIYS